MQLLRPQPITKRLEGHGEVQQLVTRREVDWRLESWEALCSFTSWIVRMRHGWSMDIEDRTIGLTLSVPSSEFSVPLDGSMVEEIRVKTSWRASGRSIV